MSQALVVAAANLAASAHSKQKYQNKALCMPYYWHVSKVCEIVNQMDVGDVDRSEVQQVALLHDIIEDTIVTAEQLTSEGFSSNVVHAIVLLSRCNKLQQDYINDIKQNELATVVKKADTLFNLTQSVLIDDKKRIMKYANQLVALTEQEVNNG